MASTIVITGIKRDAIWLEFERSEDGKRAKCKHCPLMKHATASQYKKPTNWHFVSDFCSDFQFRGLDFRYFLEFCVHEFKLRFRAFDRFLTSNFYV